MQPSMVHEDDCSGPCVPRWALLRCRGDRRGDRGSRFDRDRDEERGGMFSSLMGRLGGSRGGAGD